MSNLNNATLENAFYAWASTNGLSLTTIWAHQNAPEPRRAFNVLHIDSIRKIGWDFEADPNSTGARTRYGTREFTLNIHTHGANGDVDSSLTSVDALTALSNLMETLNDQSVISTFRLAGIVILDWDDAIDATFIEDFHQVDRAVGVVYCRASIDVAYGGSNAATQIITGAIIDGTIGNIHKTINVNGGS